MRQTGYYQKLGNLDYFIPSPLPPKDPELELTHELLELSNQASFALGLVNEMAKRLPDPDRFVRAYVIKEAILSSEIEGIHTTLLEVYTQALNQEKINKNTQLVLNYTKALKVAIEMTQEQNLPLATRVILAAHCELMSTGEGENADPGQFRKQSVRVGSLIPPPAPEIPSLIYALEKFINEKSEITPLIKAGLVHVQFETIHPFLDGNGRIGRLLIVLMLINNQLLQAPIIYPSLYFKKHHLEYYQCLDRVRTQGDFEGWIIYYLKGIRDSAMDAYARANEIDNLEKTIIHNISNHREFTKIRENAKRLLSYLFKHPITNITEAGKEIGMSYNAVENILDRFEMAGLLVKETRSDRFKHYIFKPYLDILEKNLEPQ